MSAQLHMIDDVFHVNKRQELSLCSKWWSVNSLVQIISHQWPVKSVFVTRHLIWTTCFAGGGRTTMGSCLYHLLPTSPHSPRSFLSHGVACLHWPLLSLSDMILKFQHVHVSWDTLGLLYRVDLTTLVLTEEIPSHVVSSRMMARMITSVPQGLKVYTLPV